MATRGKDPELKDTVRLVDQQTREEEKRKKKIDNFLNNMVLEKNRMNRNFRNKENELRIVLFGKVSK